ncbi:MAG: hypothetical protein DMF78_13800, partial [Acidobacteria bacterium]
MLAGAGRGTAAEPQTAPSPQPSPSPPPSPTPAPAVAASLPIRLGGSVTLRSDTVKVEDQTDLLLTDDRESAMRGRLRLWAEYRDSASSVNAGLRVSAGETPNPAGSFPRLGNGLRPESIGFDQFWVALRPFHNHDAAGVTVGKMPLPFWRGDRGTYRTQLIWDHDISPLGAALRLGWRRSPEGGREMRLENNLAGFILEDLSNPRFSGIVGKTSLIADQLHLQAPHLGLAVAFYDYQNLNAGLLSPNFTPGEGASLAQGTSAFFLRPGFQATNNAVNYGPGAEGFVRDEFHVWNALAEVDGALPFFRSLGQPQVFALADYVHNSAVPADRNGYYLVAGFYGGGRPGSRVHPWGFHFAWADVDADATLGAFANSDLGGGTDYRGWEVGANYRY